MKSLPVQTVVKVDDRKLISDFLSLNRVWASEALLSLDDSYWRVATWYGYQEGSHLGLCLIFENLSPAPVFMVGEPNCLGYIIKQVLNSDKIFVESPLSCLGSLKKSYTFESTQIMNKMQLQHFRTGSFSINPGMRRLTPEDYPLARDLYYRNSEESSGFDVDQFNNGIYFGYQEGASIVCMAGTSVICNDYRTVTIGNVITDSEYRTQGLAASAMILLCQHLMEESFDCICLKVNRGNTSAINLYRRLGFVKINEYFEGTGKRTGN